MLRVAIHQPGTAASDEVGRRFIATRTAQPFFDRLTATLRASNPPKPRGVVLECKHFFSGAALFANGKIFASLTPGGFAIKSFPTERARISSARAAAGGFDTSTGGAIKKEYVVLSRGLAADRERVRELLRAAIQHVTN